VPKSESELQKHTLNLFPGDYAKLQQFYPDIGAATIIRRIVRTFVQQIEEKGMAVEAEIHVDI
jgi:hypothetical protein